MNMIRDVSVFGDHYWNWQGMHQENLLRDLALRKFDFTFAVDQDEVPVVHLSMGRDEYGFPGRIAPHMQDGWTYFYESRKIYFYFKSESDMIAAILLK